MATVSTQVTILQCYKHYTVLFVAIDHWFSRYESLFLGTHAMALQATQSTRGPAVEPLPRE
jgi:hypothetical protein